MSLTPSTEPPPPRLHQIGRFRLVAEIARGGMGVVYLARAQEEDGSTALFAVKMLLPEFAGEEQYRRMFLAEANLGVRLEHPNIVHTVEVGGSKKQYFMASSISMANPCARCVDRCGSSLSARGYGSSPTCSRRFTTRTRSVIWTARR